MLSCFPFSEYKVKFWTIETNIFFYGCEMKDKIYEIMTKNKYYRVVEDHCYRNRPYEDWYVHEDYLYLIKDKKKWKLFFNLLDNYGTPKECGSVLKDKINFTDNCHIF